MVSMGTHFHLGPLVSFLKASVQMSSVIITLYLFFPSLLCYAFLKKLSSIDIISNCLIFSVFHFKFHREIRIDQSHVCSVFCLFVCPGNISSFSHLYVCYLYGKNPGLNLINCGWGITST